jgi:hypothetical protein
MTMKAKMARQLVAKGTQKRRRKKRKQRRMMNPLLLR